MPSSALSAANIRSTQPIRLPIGISDFGKLLQGEYTFVDKSLLIDEVLQAGAEVTLIARPRRFGKTLNLSMLQHFLADSVNGQPTRGLFDDLAVKDKPATMAHQGKYPVIFFSFKDIKPDRYAGFESQFRGQLAALYRQFPELLKSAHVDADVLEDVKMIRAKKAGRDDMAYSFRLLSELLYRHYGQKVVILLDEYDTPLHAAYINEYYEELIKFIRDLLGAALKDNPYLFKAVVTGILQVAKVSMLSELNNIDVYTVLDEPYSRCFGFTESEVDGLLKATGLASLELEGSIKGWYNGYRFGREVIYNPWSIIKCLESKGRLEPWWLNTGGDSVLKKLMAQADAGFKKGLEQLILGSTVTEPIDPKLVFGDLRGNSAALWSLLFFSGYLTALPGPVQSERELAIPNLEVRQFYEQTIRKWFTEGMDPTWYIRLLESLACGNVTELEAVLRNYLLRSSSFFDVHGKDPEKFYHGLVLGMMVGLSQSHAIFSNRESGFGRYDVALFPNAGSGRNVGVILEFKQIPDPGQLEAAAAQALEQIDRRRYRAELEQYRMLEILEIAIAFSGKEMALTSRVMN